MASGDVATVTKRDMGLSVKRKKQWVPSQYYLKCVMKNKDLTELYTILLQILKVIVTNNAH